MSMKKIFVFLALNVFCLCLHAESIKFFYWLDLESVDVNFFPFWVSTVPNDIAKIKVEFKIDEQK